MLNFLSNPKTENNINRRNESLKILTSCRFLERYFCARLVFQSELEFLKRPFRREIRHKYSCLPVSSQLGNVDRIFRFLNILRINWLCTEKYFGCENILRSEVEDVEDSGSRSGMEELRERRIFLCTMP